MQEKKKRYPRNEAVYNLIQENEAYIFLGLLPKVVYALVKNKSLWCGEGRPSKKLYDILICLSIQRYIGFSTRRSLGMIDLLTKAAGISVKIPCFKTLNNYRNKPELDYYLDKIIMLTSKEVSSLEHDFATDMTGERTKTFSAWYSIRTGKKIRRRDCLAAHITTGVKTNIVSAVDISVKKGRDNKIFREHVKKASRDFNVSSWSGDSVYASRENCTALRAKNIKPYFRLKKNVTARSKGHPAWKLMVNEYRNDQEDYDKNYHKRSNAESTNSAKKRKFNDFVRSRNAIAKENESKLGWTCYNFSVLSRAIYEFDIEPKFNID